MTVTFRGGNEHVRALVGRLRRIRAGRVADALLLGVPSARRARRAGERSLRAVTSLRIELEAVNLQESSTRVSEAGGGEEIARLARAVNRTLERLSEADDRAEHACKRQRQFAADASHELRTPIAALRMRLEDAQLHPDETDLDDLLGYMLRDLDRVQDIVADLLFLTRLGAVPRIVERVNLTELVRAQAARQVDGHHVYLRLDPGVIVDGDPDQIGQMLGNLLDNARRHAARAVRIVLCRVGDRAELTVADDGEGIPWPTASGSFTASCGWTPPAAGTGEAPASAWPSLAPSPPPITAPSTSRSPHAAERASSCGCRSRRAAARDRAART
ncbi:hypothetical protein GCM10027612_07870 [Microbispora bryophytorum subsp. camponoti]